MRQRFRWIYGTLQAAFRHRDVLFRRRFGAFAFFSLPSIMLFSLFLPLVAPLMDLMLLMALIQGAIGLFMHPQTYDPGSVIWAVTAYAFVFAIDFAIAALAFYLERDESPRLLWYMPLQRLCYRQVMYVITLRVLFSCLRGNAQGWNKLARLGSVALVGGRQS
jgi:peptidoglycan-N-acetylglucosamine deacetylase